MSHNHLSDLASKCQGVAHCLTYNDDKHQSDAKQLLIEAAHALDGQSIRMHKKRDGLLIINARGKCRFLTLRERFAVWILRGNTEIRP